MVGGKLIFLSIELRNGKVTVSTFRRINSRVLNFCMEQHYLAMKLILSDILKYQEPHNIIVVDWEKDASYIYSIASARVPFVAYDLERFLNRQLAGDNLNKMHLVGFGLGAHVAGIASRWVNLRDPNNVDGDREQVQRITGNSFLIYFH